MIPGYSLTQTERETLAADLYEVNADRLKSAALLAGLVVFAMAAGNPKEIARIVHQAAAPFDGEPHEQ